MKAAGGSVLVSPAGDGAGRLRVRTVFGGLFKADSQPSGRRRAGRPLRRVRAALRDRVRSAIAKIGRECELPPLRYRCCTIPWPCSRALLALATAPCSSCCAGTKCPRGKSPIITRACLIILAGVSLVGGVNDLVDCFWRSSSSASRPTFSFTCPNTMTPRKKRRSSNFLLSIFSSGLLLFGFSYLFGLTGTTNIAGILRRLLQRLPGGEQGSQRPGADQHADDRGGPGLSHHGGAISLLCRRTSFKGPRRAARRSCRTSQDCRLRGDPARVRLHCSLGRGSGQPGDRLALTEQVPTCSGSSPP